MTPTEMEDALNNLDHRLSRVEQILPTLATKDDLEELKRHTSMVCAGVRDDIRKLAEGVVTLTTIVESLITKIDRY